MKSVLFTALSLIVSMMAVPAIANQHALLIGISDYTDDRITDLEGPVHDVRALQQSLIDQWGFQADNITTLIDDQATERAILGALDALASSTEPDDDIIIYFSGHGTSAHDPDLGARLHLPDGSGAIVSSDFNPDNLQRSALREPASDGLLIGRHELRPRFQALDENRNVLIMFDACFSGNSARDYGSAYTPKTKRQLSLLNKLTALFVSNDDVHDSDGLSADDYMSSEISNNESALNFAYQNTVYIGAAAEDQLAVDFSQAEIDAGLVSTLDGKPHGGFTDALLRVLQLPERSGVATVSDQRKQSYSHARLFNRLVNQFNLHCKACGHTPVSLPLANHANKQLMSRIILRRNQDQPTTTSVDTHRAHAAASSGISETAQNLADTTGIAEFIDSANSAEMASNIKHSVVDPSRLIVDYQSASLPQNLRAILARYTTPADRRHAIDPTGGTASTRTPLQYPAADLIVSLQDDAIVLQGANGQLIHRFPNTLEPTELANWLDAQQWLKRRTLSDVYQEQGNLRVEFRHPLFGNRVAEGDFIHFTIHSEVDANVFALVLDAQGSLSVLYPVTHDEASEAINAHQPIRLPGTDDFQIKVSPPWGTDVVLFYALPVAHPMINEVLAMAARPRIELNDPALAQWLATLDHGQTPYSASQIHIVSSARP